MKLFILFLLMHLNLLVCAQSDDIVELLFPSEILKKNRCKQLLMYSLIVDENQIGQNEDFKSQIISRVFFDKYGKQIGIAYLNSQLTWQSFKNYYDENKNLVITLVNRGSYKDTIRYEYDEKGRMQKIIHKEKNGVWVRKRKYDDQSRLIEKEGFYMNVNGDIDTTKTVKRLYYYENEGVLSAIENLVSNDMLLNSKKIYRNIKGEVVLIVEEKFVYLNGVPKSTKKSIVIEYSKSGIPLQITEFVDSDKGKPNSVVAFVMK